MGCELQQIRNDRATKPFGYFSVSRTDAEQKHDTSQRDYSSIAQFVLLLGPCLEKYGFTIRMDHDSLKWNFILADSTGKIARCQLHLPDLIFIDVYCSSNMHETVNSFSGFFTTGKEKTLFEDYLPVLADVESKGTENDNIYATETCNKYVISLISTSTETSIDTSPTRKKFLLEQIDTQTLL